MQRVQTAQNRNFIQLKLKRINASQAMKSFGYELEVRVPSPLERDK